MNQPISTPLLSNPLMVALDVDDERRAVALASELSGLAGAFKVGPRLALKYGESFVQKLAASAPVFLDQKFLDIPNTMEASVRAAFHSGATFTTVHAWAGPEALKRMAKVERELSQHRPFCILVVTILTSFEQTTLPVTNRSMPLFQQVEQLALEAADCGMKGFVCSPMEVGHLKRQIPEGFFVTPGIRWQEGPFSSVEQRPADDQKRTLTPAEAIENGANALVIGRPIVESANPRVAAQSALVAIQNASV